MSRIEDLIRLSRGGDEEATGVLVEENSGLIWSVVKRFIGRGTDAEDLYQLGCLGFLKAVDGFDLEYGTQFSTYAVPKIAGEIRRFLRDDGSVKVSRTLKEQAATIRAVRNKLMNSLGREPTITEISELTGYTTEEIVTAENATAATESIHKETGEDGYTLENILSNTESEETMVEKISLRQAIEHLSEREALVIKLRYYHGLTQERVSKVLSVSQVQVSRIEKRALANLKLLMS